MWPYKLGPVNWEMLGNQIQTSFRLRERDGKSKLDMMATFPRAASLTQQPPGPEDEDPSLDEYNLYSLAHSFLEWEAGKVVPRKKLWLTSTAPIPGGMRGSC
ncbi:Nuclear Protein 1 [Manis pentadactyla]|nr:Nuclear Protein 1 [Manis pentadactyla]